MKLEEENNFIKTSNRFVCSQKMEILQKPQPRKKRIKNNNKKQIFL